MIIIIIIIIIISLLYMRTFTLDQPRKNRKTVYTLYEIQPTGPYIFTEDCCTVDFTNKTELIHRYTTLYTFLAKFKIWII